MPSGNPALNSKVFAEAARRVTAGSAELMTLDGTAVKTAVLIALVTVSASYTWSLYFTTHSIASISLWVWVCSIAAFLVGLVTIFKKTLSPYTSPVYAVLEGLALGAVSAFLNDKYPGIAIESVGLSFAILISLLLIYTTGLIKPSENFKIGVAAATGGIAIYYLVALGMSLCGRQAPLIWDSGPWGIAFSVFVIVIASFNLVIDFDFIEEGVKEGAPKYMEWYGAFGLMVTLIWLYLEILRLLAKLRKR